MIEAVSTVAQRCRALSLMPTVGPDVVIWGITHAGRKFRPSDWAERLAGLTSAFGEDHKLAYSPLVLPMTIASVKVVIVGHELESLEPRLFRFLMAFAQDNELQTMAASDALAAPQALRPPVPSVSEPREPV
jgi:hypothetical protein